MSTKKETIEQTEVKQESKKFERFIGTTKLIITQNVKELDYQEYKVECCRNEYLCKIAYVESRLKYLVTIEINGRRQSLSFFDNSIVAYKNAMNFIVLSNGGTVQENNGVGD